MKRIAIYPRSDGVNKYLERNASLLRSSFDACVSQAPTVKEIILSPIKCIRFRKYDVIVVNWLENLIRGRNHGVSFFGVFWFFFYLVFYKFSSRKLIYVRHNYYPHQMEGWHAKLANRITSLGADFCDEKVSHSGHLSSYGYVYIPHPIYEIESPKSTYLDFSNEEPYYVIFGSIKRYKNIESVIDFWDSNIRLIVAGVPEEESYVDELVNLASGKNIVIRPRYLSEAEAQELVSRSCGLILAQTSKEMVVSGSYFYAITLGVPVFTLEQPFFNWVKREYGFEGLFIYSSISKLVGCIACEGAPVFSNELIKKRASELFGDQVVIRAWREVI